MLKQPHVRRDLLGVAAMVINVMMHASNWVLLQDLVSPMVLIRDLFAFATTTVKSERLKLHLSSPSLQVPIYVNK